MKNRFTTFLAISSVLFTLGFTSCGNDDEDKPAPGYTCTTCNNTPEAKAEHDNSSKGIYKGVVVGSSGKIKINIMNSENNVSATLTIDDQDVPLTTTTQYTAGQAYTPEFTGTLNSQPVSVVFSVQADGSAPTIVSYSIPSHPNTNFLMAKESSTGLVKVFEGTYSGQKDNGQAQSGTLNVVFDLEANTWSGITKETGRTEVGVISGTLSGTTITCSCGPETTVVGTLNGDQISGTYQGSDNNGTWSAQRSL